MQTGEQRVWTTSGHIPFGDRACGWHIGHAIAAEAEQWIDTPFRWQGRIKGRGVDCKGLIAGVAAACGRPEAGSVEALAGDYGKAVDARRLKAGLARLFDRVTERRPGDVLLVRLGQKAQHLVIAAPRPNQPTRVIEAMNVGPKKVRPFRRSEAEIDSIWRWKNG